MLKKHKPTNEQPQPNHPAPPQANNPQNPE